MTSRLVPIVTAAIALILLTMALPRTSSAEEETGEWKWVDAYDNCVSVCDSTKYTCPCYRR